MHSDKKLCFFLLSRASFFSEVPFSSTAFPFCLVSGFGVFLVVTGVACFAPLLEGLLFLCGFRVHEYWPLLLVWS